MQGFKTQHAEDIGLLWFQLSAASRQKADLLSGKLLVHKPLTQCGVHWVQHGRLLWDHKKKIRKQLMVIIINRNFEELGRLFCGKVDASAIIDRTVHQATTVKLNTKQLPYKRTSTVKEFRMIKRKVYLMEASVIPLCL